MPKLFSLVGGKCFCQIESSYGKGEAGQYDHLSSFYEQAKRCVTDRHEARSVFYPSKLSLTIEATLSGVFNITGNQKKGKKGIAAAKELIEKFIADEVNEIPYAILREDGRELAVCKLDRSTKDSPFWQILRIGHLSLDEIGFFVNTLKEAEIFY